MSDVYVLHIFKIFEEENSVERIVPPSLQSVDDLALVNQLFLSLFNVLTRFDQQLQRLD